MRGSTPSSSKRFCTSGAASALASSWCTRSTTARCTLAGVGGYDVASWNAIAAPAKTPRAVIERVHQELVKAVAAPEVQKRFAELGVDPRTSTPEALREFFVSESARWTRVVEAAKIPKQ